MARDPQLPVIYTGRADEQPTRRTLRAGPLSLVLEEGDLRYIRLGDREVVRRVYVAVRDANWGTIPPVYTDMRLVARADSFDLTFDALHQDGPIAFTWHGVVRGAADGTITYRMDGEALATFRKNRIGICVLHPMSCAGARCTVEHVDGSREDGRFPEQIAPHQPFLDLQAITHEVAPGVRAEVRLDGDVFEMEDQRNWIDASFKTYSTPLRLPFPVEVQRGTRIVQSFSLTCHVDDPDALPRSTAEDSEAVVKVNVDPALSHSLPRLGLSVASHGQPLEEQEVARLRALHLAHLRVDLDLADVRHGLALRRAWAEAAALGIGLEVALFVSEAAARELTALARLIGEVRPAVVRWLIFHTREPVTDARWVALARQILAGLTPGAAVGGGTNAYFAQLNRNRPALGVLDLVSYSANPQVHAFDDASLAETPPAITTTLRSARAFCGDRSLVVSPLTLRPRFNPDATGPVPEPAPGALPSQVDPRQAALLGGGWTLASLTHLAAGGAWSATLYETTGWRGVMETASGPALPARFPSRPRMLFPLYHVLADVGEMATGETVVPVLDSSDPLAVEGLALRWGLRTRVLLANLSPAPRLVLVRVAGHRSPRARVRILDERTFGQAAYEGDAFRRTEGDLQDAAGDGALHVRLLPYAIARIDIEGDAGR